METKFNLYDLFGILIPGGVLCIVVYYFLKGMGYIGGLESGWVQAILLLPVAYTSGTFIHHLARQFLHVEEFSLKLLTEQDKEFSAEFTTQLLAKVTEVFKITQPTDINQREFQQMAFKLCYDYVIQNGKGVYAENFNALYGMCRSMILVTIGGSTLAVIWFLNKSDHCPLWVVIILIVGFFIAAIFYQGMLLNASRFAISVYRSFYIAAACAAPNSAAKN